MIPLSKQEQRVVDFLGMGLGNREIANILGIKLRTVKANITNISNKWNIDRKRFLPRVRIIYLESVRKKGEENDNHNTVEKTATTKENHHQFRHSTEEERRQQRSAEGGAATGL
jgi:hypothetical protein